MPDNEIPTIALPLTPYDILGYLAPGGTLLLSCLIFEHFLKAVVAPQLKTVSWHTPLLSATKTLYSSSVEPTNSISLALFAICFAAVAYITGHVVGSAASILLDRALVFKGYGYPYSSLLRLTRDETVPRRFSRAFYRGLFFWINAFILLLYLGLFLAAPLSFHRLAWWLRHLSYAILLFVAFAIVFKLFVDTKWMRESSRMHFARTTALTWMARFLDGPYELVAHPLSKVMNTRNSFDDEFIKTFREKFAARFGLRSESAGTNNYWMCYCYVLEECPELRGLVTHWLRMYVFARNLAAAFYLAFLYCFIWLITEAPALGEHDPRIVAPTLFLPAMLFVSSFLLLLRYYYLFVSYFTKFIFRAFVYAEAARSE